MEDNSEKNQITTDGATYVAGNVSEGHNFIGRDQMVINVSSGSFVGRDTVNFHIGNDSEISSATKLDKTATSIGFSLLGVLLSIVAGVLGNRVAGLIQLPSVPSGILTIGSTIFVGTVILGVVFFLAWRYFQHRNQQQQAAFKHLIEVESSLFASIDAQVNQLIQR